MLEMRNSVSSDLVLALANECRLESRDHQDEP